MAKDKASGSAGGSRAAKKRRKLKDKVPPAAVRGTASQQVAPLSKESHHQHPTTSARTSSKAESETQTHQVRRSSMTAALGRALSKSKVFPVESNLIVSMTSF